MTTKPQTRLPYVEPTHPHDPISPSVPARKIRFLHPGYPRSSNILLHFSAYDANHGIYYQAAQDACAVVANSRWDGFFSTDREGHERVDPEKLSGRSLNQDEYYFQVPRLGNTHECDRDYPIIPTFAEYPFPHNDMPTHWSGLLGKDLDTGFSPAHADLCCMTKSSLALETAHIVPTNPSDLRWFDTNVMGQYAGVNSQANTLRLKVDVHQVFDRKPRFAIIPKYGRIVAHIFNADDAMEAVELYHNVPLQPLNGKEIRFLFARMAWTVFSHLDLFMKARVCRKLVRLVNQQQVTQETDGDTCDQISKGTRSRSVSPRKRLASQMRAEQPEDFNDVDVYYTEQERSSESQTRGRKRRRSSYDQLVRRDGSCTPSGPELHRSGSELSESTDAVILNNLQG